MTNRSRDQIAADNQKAITSVHDWLKEQDPYLFKAAHRDPQNARKRLDLINDSETQEYWQRFQRYRQMWQHREMASHMTGEYSLRTSYFALASAAIARAKFVLTGVAMNNDFETCQRASWAVLDRYIDKLGTGEEALPGRIILGRMMLAEVVDGYRGERGAYPKIEPTFITLAGCAMTAVSEQIGAANGTATLPEPAMLNLAFTAGNVWGNP